MVGSALRDHELFSALSKKRFPGWEETNQARKQALESLTSGRIGEPPADTLDQ